MDTRRRHLLFALGASVAAAGCLDSAADEATDAAENETDDIASSPSDCSLRGDLVDEPPAEAPVVDADELEDNALLERLFEAARDPDERTGESTRPSGEYESASVEPESASELEDVRELLDAQPSFDDEEYPTGVYVAEGELTLAVSLTCLT